MSKLLQGVIKFELILAALIALSFFCLTYPFVVSLYYAFVDSTSLFSGPFLAYPFVLFLFFVFVLSCYLMFAFFLLNGVEEIHVERWARRALKQRGREGVVSVGSGLPEIPLGDIRAQDNIVAVRFGLRQNQHCGEFWERPHLQLVKRRK